MGQALLGTIDGIGYVVADLAGAVARRTARPGGDLRTIFRNSAPGGTDRASRTRGVMDVALGWQGGVQIERAAVRPVTPSPCTEAGGRCPACMISAGSSTISTRRSHGRASAGRCRCSRPPVRRCASPLARAPGEDDARYELIEGKGMHAMMDEGLAETAGWDGSDRGVVIDLGGAA